MSGNRWSAEKLRRQSCGQRDPGSDDERLACGRRGRVPDRLFVLEPGAHARLRDRFDNERRGQLRGVVTDAKPLAHEIGHELLEPGQILEPALEDSHLFATIHAVDLENRLRMDFAHRANGMLLQPSVASASFNLP